MCPRRPSVRSPGSRTRGGWAGSRRANGCSTSVPAPALVVVMRPARGVVHALRNIHAALAADGILVDTQPASASPPVAVEGGELGSLDMREWLDTIHAVDERTAETIAAGLYELDHESWFVVTDTYDNGPECLDIVSGWRGTRVPSRVSQQLAAATSRVSVQQEVGLRLLRRAP
jgi:hypothetical protein